MIFLRVFIEHQSHHSCENNPEQNWRYCETSSAINDYCGQQQRWHYQPTHYNEPQQYFHNITSRNTSSYNAYERVKVDHKSSIHSGIPTPSRKHGPIITTVPEQKHIKNIHLFILEVFWWQKTYMCISKSCIPIHSLRRKFNFLISINFIQGFNWSRSYHSRQVKTNTSIFGCHRNGTRTTIAEG